MSPWWLPQGSDSLLEVDEYERKLKAYRAVSRRHALGNHNRKYRSASLGRGHRGSGMVRTRHRDSLGSHTVAGSDWVSGNDPYADHRDIGWRFSLGALRALGCSVMDGQKIFVLPGRSVLFLVL